MLDPLFGRASASSAPPLALDAPESCENPTQLLTENVEDVRTLIFKGRSYCSLWDPSVCGHSFLIKTSTSLVLLSCFQHPWMFRTTTQKFPTFLRFKSCPLPKIIFGIPWWRTQQDTISINWTQIFASIFSLAQFGGIRAYFFNRGAVDSAQILKPGVAMS